MKEPAAELAPNAHPLQVIANKLYGSPMPAPAGGNAGMSERALQDRLDPNSRALKGAAIIGMAERQLQDLGMDEPTAKSVVADTARAATESLQLQGRDPERFVEVVAQLRTRKPRTPEELEALFATNSTFWLETHVIRARPWPGRRRTPKPDRTHTPGIV